MHVEVSNTLADACIGRHKVPIGRERSLYCTRKQPCVGQEGSSQVLREISEGGYLLAWNQQHVPEEDRAVIGEGEGHLALEIHGCRNGPGDHCKGAARVAQRGVDPEGSTAWSDGVRDRTGGSIARLTDAIKHSGGFHVARG